MLLVMARLGNPEIVGQFTLALALTTPVVSLGLLVTAAIVLILGYRGTLAAVIIVVGIAKAIEAVSDIFHAFLQQHDGWTELLAPSRSKASCPSPIGLDVDYPLSRRNDRGAVIVTSNQSLGVWGDVFGDSVIAAAILERLLHHPSPSL
jgi:hypothetical protein